MKRGNPVNSSKVYVKVASITMPDGRMIPKTLYWEDGQPYYIDKITDVKPAASMKAGGCGDRYTIWVNGKQTYLFFERNASVTGNNIGRWFIERKGA